MEPAIIIWKGLAAFSSSFCCVLWNNFSTFFLGNLLLGHLFFLVIYYLGIFLTAKLKLSANIATLAFPCFDGCYLPKQENEFVHTVLHELDAYLQREKQKSALLFPPLSSRLRYLIHKTTENHRNLATFSVGEGWSRRVVVCYSHLRLDLGDESNTDSFYNEAPRRGMGMQSSRMDLQPRPLAQRSGGNAKRPDKAIYVPRAARDRQRDSGNNLHGPPAGVDLDMPLPSLSFTSTSTSESCSCCSSDTTEGTLSETQANTNQDSVPSNTTSAGQEEDFIRFSAEEPCPHAPAWGQTVSYFMALTLEHQTREAQEEEEHVAEEVLTEESLTEESSVGSSNVASHQHHASHTTPAKDAANDAVDFSQEIKAHLTETDVAIEHAHNDYSCFENVWINQDEFGHVIEIYDFPAMFKTGDLLDAFADYSDEGMKIKWVDNTHALGVFSSQSAALHALSIRHPLLKTCTLSDGSKKAKGKAIRRAEFIQPVKERPRTDSVVARRMVSRALGVQRGGTPSQRF